jgi:hypothetical protein
VNKGSDHSVYREEYRDKDGSKREETNFSFPGARVFHKAEDQQILKLDFPSSATSSPYVGESRPSFPGARVFHKAEDQQILKLDFPSSATSSPYVGESSLFFH